MGKFQFLMDTAGHCFVCLKGAQPTPTGDEQADPKIASFQNLCKYLHINLGEVRGEAMSLKSGSVPLLEKSELKGLLCEGCIPLFDQFSKQFLELEVMKMKMSYGLKLIYEKMLAAEDDTQVEEEERLLRKKVALRNGFVEQLRKKTLERCSSVIEREHPLLKPTQTQLFVEESSSASEGATSAEAQICGVASGEMESPVLPGPATGPESTDDEEDDSEQFRCDYCFKKFYISFARNQHMKLNCPVRFLQACSTSNLGHANGQTTTSAIPEEPLNSFECFVCQSTFPLEQQESHYHGQKRLCRQCYVNFGTDGSLRIQRLKTEPVEEEENGDDDDDIVIDIDANILRESGLIMITEESKRTTTVEEEEAVEPPPTSISAAAAIPSTSATPSTNHIESETSSHLEAVSGSRPVELERGVMSRQTRVPARTARYSHGYVYEMEFACEHCRKPYALKFQRDRHEQNCPDIKRPPSGVDTLLDPIPAETNEEGNQEAPENMEPAIPSTSTSASTSPSSPPTQKSLVEVAALKSSVHKRPKTKPQCGTCPMKFKSKQGLRRHVQSVHLQQRAECPFCSKMFSSTSNRNLHMKRSCPNKEKEPDDDDDEWLPSEFDSDSDQPTLPVKMRRMASPATPTEEVELFPPVIDGPFTEDEMESGADEEREA